MDNEVELFYLASRYYSPEANRFISSDCFVGGSLLHINLYAYCSNSPVSQIDPLGYDGYYVIFNVYDPAGWNQNNGHYDISIISTVNPAIGWTFSYGQVSESDSTGRFMYFDSPTRTGKLNELKGRYIIYDALSEEDYQAFLEYFKGFINESNLVDKEKYQVPSSHPLATYDTDNLIYCGPGAVELFSKMNGILDATKNKYSEGIIPLIHTLCTNKLVVTSEVKSWLAGLFEPYPEKNWLN